MRRLLIGYYTWMQVLRETINCMYLHFRIGDASFISHVPVCFTCQHDTFRTTRCHLQSLWANINKGHKHKCVHSPNNLMGLADCTTYSPGNGGLSCTVSSPLWKIELPYASAYSNQNFNFLLIPPGTHYYWVDSSSMEWKKTILQTIWSTNCLFLRLLEIT